MREVLHNSIIDANVPIGIITPFHGGYHADGANGTFTMVMAAGNTVSDVNNAFPHSKACDGSSVNDSDSPIFNGSGRYLPNLSNRYISGNTTAGAIGGVSTFDNSVLNAYDSHTHGVGTLYSQVNRLDYAAGFSIYYSTQVRVKSSSSWSSNRQSNGVSVSNRSNSTGFSTIGTSGASDSGGFSGTRSNEPKYLNVFLMMRIK